MTSIWGAIDFWLGIFFPCSETQAFPPLIDELAEAPALKNQKFWTVSAEFKAGSRLVLTGRMCKQS